MKHISRAAADHLARAETLRKERDSASLTYAALELRLGIEARLKEYVDLVVGVSESVKSRWEIAKLGKTLESKYGLADGMQIIFVTLNEQRVQFMYVPVSTRLQQIGGLLGGYLHWKPLEPGVESRYWDELASLLHEGCGLLQLACAGEVLRPSFSDGLHFILDAADPRVPIVKALCDGAPAKFEVFQITPVGPITYYPANAA